mmetsp:Transcript_68236/g.142612  ORF Transcript_68236/g.142612 Transcript_68236/m.142612 type:complete len:119 (-) Transcript_68236:96-452(-)
MKGEKQLSKSATARQGHYDIPGDRAWMGRADVEAGTLKDQHRRGLTETPKCKETRKARCARESAMQGGAQNRTIASMQKGTAARGSRNCCALMQKFEATWANEESENLMIVSIKEKCG